MATQSVTPAQTLRPLAELSNTQLLNLIRNEAAPEYQKRIPSATQANVNRVVSSIMSSTQNKNEFYNTLINRIGGTYVNTWTWNNPLGVFTRASQMYGDTWQEIAVGMPTAQVYDPDADYLGADNFKKWKVPVDSLYHRIDFMHFYPVTTDDRMLNRAFVSANGLGQLTTQLINSCYNAANVDIFETLCHMFVEYAKLGGYWRVHMDNDLNKMSSTQDQARDMLRQIRAWADTLKFVSTKYNARHMPTYANRDNLVLFCSPEVKSALDVQGLATVFQRTDAEPTIDRIIVVPQDRFGIDGVQAILTTDTFLIDIPVIEEMTTQVNPVNINATNHFLHMQRIISVSGFAPAVLFWTGKASTESVTLPTGTAATKPDFALRLSAYGEAPTKPTDVARGGAVQVEAATSITNDDEATWKSDAVSYQLADSTKPYSEWTYISDTGVLMVGLDEPNTTIKVTATAQYTDPKTPEIKQTASAALDVPVTGAGVIGFKPSMITAVTVDNITDLKAKETTQAHATATLLDGRQVDVTALALWTMDATTYATVDTAGVVTGVAQGTGKLTATVFGVTSAQATVNVMAAAA